MHTKKQIHALINQINDLDLKSATAQYEIGNILTAIHDHHLYEQMGDGNFAFFISSRMEFSNATAWKYIKLYRISVTLKYTKKEFIPLIRKYGWGRLLFLMSKADKKVGVRTLNQWDKERGDPQDMPMTFHMPEEDQGLVDTVLEGYGMTYHPSGRRIGMTDALKSLALDVAQRDKARKAS